MSKVRALVVAVAVLGLAGCEDTITNPGACPAVATGDLRLTTGLGNVASMRVGESGRFDFSPLDINGNPLPRICHAATASWAVEPETAGEFYGQTNSYQVFFRAHAAGQARVIARSGGITADFHVDIQP
jgi:hypothetical protein